MQEKQTIIGTLYQRYSKWPNYWKKGQIWVSRRNIKQGQLTFCGPYSSHFCLKHHNIWHTSILYRKYLMFTVNSFCKNTSLVLHKSVPNRKKWIFSNLLENKAITPKKHCAPQEMTRILLVPCVYISYKPRKWTFTCFFLRKMAEKVVWQKCPWCEKKCAYFL